MSNSTLQSAVATLVKDYARRGSYPRPDQVTEQALEELRQLCAAATLVVSEPDHTTAPPRSRYSDQTLKQIILDLDSQMDTYENSELLVNQHISL